jgi:hypothetical protein
VLAVIQVAGRLLWRHWPALLAWYLAAILARYLVIEVAGWVGAHSAVAGSLLLPLAILARLVALVAMFLVLRDGMRELAVIAPAPPTGCERRRAFLNALMAGILPFFAFYAAWGYLREDAAAYSNRVLEVSTELDFTAIVDGTQTAGDGLAGEITLTPLTGIVVVVAFALRFAWKRYRERLPRWTGVLATYLEALWVYFAVSVIGIGLGYVTSWVGSRQAMVWLNDFRATITESFAALAWLWEGVEWFLGEAGGIILLPVAWLTIAGVLYGQAVAPRPVAIENAGGALVTRVRTRYRSLPARLRSRLYDVWSDLVARFTPIGRALVLMWRAGPVLIGGFVLLYTVLLAVQGFAEWGLTRVIGPHDIDAFWLVADQAIFLIVPVLIEPVRVVLVASGYDAVIGRLVSRQGSTTALTKDGMDAADSTSTAKGPEASSGTR